MGIQTAGPKSGTSLGNMEHKDYPYLLNGLEGPARGLRGIGRMHVVLPTLPK